MTNGDLAHRSLEIHWPAGFSPTEADVFSHNEIVINAPRSTVWRHLVEAEKWPQWYPTSQDVHVLDGGSGVLGEGSRFDWRTFGLDLSSTVSEFVPDSRIGWYGEGPGLHAYHTWLLTDEPSGCLVVMEEVGKGPGAVKMRETDPEDLHRGHDLWNDGLKRLAEG
jgi:uncharacterized protein YndB with AHSA1/START domain